MNSLLTLQIASAATLIDSAAELILDASVVLKDAGDTDGAQALEQLSVTVAAELKTICDRLGIDEPALSRRS